MNERSGSVGVTADAVGETTLAGFLLARVTEDERRARAVADVQGDGWTVVRHRDERGFPDWCIHTADGMPFVEQVGNGGDQDRRLCAEHIAVEADPARVLAECAAKRALVELWLRIADYELGVDLEQTQGWETLCILAQPYADHLDFDPAWVNR